MTLSFPEVVEEFRQRRIEASSNGSTGTAKRYVHSVEAWAEWLAEEQDKDVYDATYHDLLGYCRHLKREGYAPSSRQTQVAGISKFHQGLLKLDADPSYELPRSAPENPYEEFDDDDRKRFLSGKGPKEQGLAQEGEIVYLSPEEVEQLVDNAPAPMIRSQLILRLLFDTGLRRGELRCIELRHLDRDDHSIYVPPFKSSEERTVTFTPKYVDFLLDEWLNAGYRDAQNADSPYLFPSSQSEQISGEQIYRTVFESAENAGLQEVIGEKSNGRKIYKIGVHTLRHSHAVQAIRSGIDVRRLQSSLGHHSLDQTLDYLRIVEKDYVQESRKFDPFG